MPGVGAESADRGIGDGWRGWIQRHSTRLNGPTPAAPSLSWIGRERLAVGSLPTAAFLRLLPEQGVTHVVNCRARAQTWLTRDLEAERAVFGAARVIHAPMWDTGRGQRPALWSAAAVFAASALDEDPHAGVLIHCQLGRRRSVLVAYAVLRLRGHSAERAAELILTHRREAELVPEYRACVERWLA